jgi:hypothetical protein
MSREVEKLLKRMILPNADLRCLASAALLDPYWGVLPSTPSTLSLHSKLAIFFYRSIMFLISL